MNDKNHECGHNDVSRDHDLQASIAMLSDILAAAKEGGLPVKLGEKIERKLRNHLDRASDKALRWIADGINFDEWNRRLDEYPA
jgi:hypothetical protein